jgi:peptidoglycan/LPS O-acetylase OafA/YrhL
MYYPKLNSLRAIAIILVLIEHFAYAIGSHFSAGYYGVDLFFVLSGFLITNILLKKNDNTNFKNWVNFIGRRALRIFPIYYLTILVLLIFDYQPLKQELLYVATYTYNYAWEYFELPLSNISHFWSLAVEEQFYLVWPIIVLSFLKFKRVLLIIMVFVYVVCSLQLCFNIFENLALFNSVGLFPQANSLALGGLGSLLLKHRLYFLLFYALIFAGTEKLLICPIISLIFILKITEDSVKVNLFNKILSSSKLMFIGSISYGIYVYHLPLEHYVTTFVFDPYFWQLIPFDKLGSLSVLQYHSWAIKLPLYSILSIGIAHISFSYIEKPILGLKDKYFK